MDTRTETNSSGPVADRLATVLADTYTLLAGAGFRHAAG